MVHYSCRKNVFFHIMHQKYLFKLQGSFCTGCRGEEQQGTQLLTHESVSSCSMEVTAADGQQPQPALDWDSHSPEPFLVVRKALVTDSEMGFVYYGFSGSHSGM